jgi:hypothetical protein
MIPNPVHPKKENTLMKYTYYRYKISLVLELMGETNIKVKRKGTLEFIAAISYIAICAPPLLYQK